LGRGPRNNRLDFGSDPDYDPDPGIFVKNSLLTTAIPTDSQESNLTILGRCMHSTECSLVDFCFCSAIYAVLVLKSHILYSYVYYLFIPRSHSYCLSLPLCLEWYNGSITPRVHSAVTKRIQCRLYYRPSATVE